MAGSAQGGGLYGADASAIGLTSTVMLSSAAFGGQGGTGAPGGTSATATGPRAARWRGGAAQGGAIYAEDAVRPVSAAPR